MTLEVLQVAMVSAMKNKDKARKDTISSLIGAVKKTAIDKKCKDNITETLVDEVILKEKKTVQEMIDGCPAERTELLQEYKNRMAVIDEFAPRLMTDATEIQNVITTLLSDAQIEPVKANKGQIMKIVMPAMKGKADMKIVNTVIAEMLK
jgi:uncharacterized protein YqeY